MIGYDEPPTWITVGLGLFVFAAAWLAIEVAIHFKKPQKPERISRKTLDKYKEHTDDY